MIFKYAIAMMDPVPSPIRSDFDVFSSGCPARTVLDIVADKWPLLVVHALSAGSARTAQLRRRIDGVSEKMLIQTLRRLERHGLVSRIAYPEVPPRVEYALTPLGRSLSEPITALDRWVEANAQTIHAARHAFDREHGADQGLER